MIHDCADGNMRDLLPGYAHGALSATERASVAAHLAACAACAAELELIEAASRAFSTPVVDVDRIVRALPPAPRAATRGASLGMAWRAAAAIAIVAIGALSVITLRGVIDTAPRRDTAAPAPAPGTAIASSSRAAPAGAAAVAAPAAAPGRAAPGISFGGGLSDLSDDQLDTLLGELDSLDSLPSAEPETHLSPIVPEADGGHNAR